MNWVGGFRSRMIVKQERQKQREFFQKKKMKSKLKLLDKSSDETKASLSLDLLNLHVVNQISKKKESSKLPQHVDVGKRKDTFPDLRRNLQLPMSPITVPSKICVDDSEIISPHTKTLECRTDQNYSTKQELKHEEKGDMTTEAKRKHDIHSESNEKQTRQKMEPEFPHCLYDKCTSDENGITLSAENITQDIKVKLPLQCSKSHLNNISLFEMQDDLFSNISSSNKIGKRDVSVQCNLDQEYKFIEYFYNNRNEALNLLNNAANVEATGWQSSPQHDAFESRAKDFNMEHFDDMVSGVV